MLILRLVDDIGCHRVKAKVMKFTVLSDNRTADPSLSTEHGLSILLETERHRVLLDTGASDVFEQNAARLGIDLGSVDYVFLSHGHADHAGGLAAFLQVNKKAKIIVSPEAVSGRFFSKRGFLHSITTEWPLEEMRDRTVYVSHSQPVTDDLQVIARIPQHHPMPMGNSNLYIESEGEYVPDRFRHEMALYMGGLLFSGCAHNGLENILAACPWPVHTVVGGFHLLDAHLNESYEPTGELTALGRRLAERYPTTAFYTGHCTGSKAFETLHSAMGDRLHAFSCGMQVEVGQ